MWRSEEVASIHLNGLIQQDYFHYDAKRATGALATGRRVLGHGKRGADGIVKKDNQFTNETSRIQCI